MGEPAKPTTRVPPEVYADPLFSRKYVIEREIGRGGAGVVVCARHLELDERVAIKFLLPGAADVNAVARFRREARAANRLKDEHVVGIIDVATTEGGIPYVVMEYLDGIDLERMLLESPNRQLPVTDAIEFVLQACEALAECHRIGIVHRDLKPSNLFCVHGVDGLPLVKVLDFGISKLSTTTTLDSVMTARHAIIGSPRYMSPEQFDTPAEVDLRTDIWAIGVILYELVTGQVPFGESTLMKIWHQVKTEQPRALEELRRDAPAALTPVVLRCLQKSPARRYQNVAELARALLPFASERARGSVARIARILGSGSTAGAPGPLAGQSSEGPTTVSLSPDATIRERPRGTSRALMAGAVVAAGIAGFLVMRGAGNGLTPPKPPAVAAPEQVTATDVPAGDTTPPLVIEPEAALPAPPPVEKEADAAKPTRTISPNATAPSPDSTANRALPKTSRPIEPAGSAHVSPSPSPHVANSEELGSSAPASGPLPAASAAAAPSPADPAPPAEPAATPSAPASSSPRFLVDIVERRKGRKRGNVE